MSLFTHIEWLYYRISYPVRSCIHLRHWRGRRIHSPFMYGVVREVFMKKTAAGPDRRFYNRLRESGVGKKNSVILQNLYTHCKVEDFVIFGCDEEAGLFLKGEGSAGIYVLLSGVTALAVLEVARRLNGTRAVLTVTSPHLDTERRRVSARIWNEFDCVSVDRRLMRLYFFDPLLTPMHYVI